MDTKTKIKLYSKGEYISSNITIDGQTIRTKDLTNEQIFDIINTLDKAKDYYLKLPNNNINLNDAFISFQHRVKEWAIKCFGITIATNRKERNYRFLEESLELVQSLNLTKDEAHKLVEYVFNRPKGDPRQEVGGVMTTIASLCNANDFNLELCANNELMRINTPTILEKIRIKQANKPNQTSPLPGSEYQENVKYHYYYNASIVTNDGIIVIAKDAEQAHELITNSAVIFSVDYRFEDWYKGVVTNYKRPFIFPKNNNYGNHEQFG